MEKFDESDYLTISVEKLFGRLLDDIEEKHAPKTLYIKGTMEIPLPLPRWVLVATNLPFCLFDNDRIPHIM